MNFQKIKQTFEYSDKRGSEERKPMLEWITYLTLFFLAIYGIRAYVESDYTHAIVNSVVLLFTAIVLFAYKKFNWLSLLVFYINVFITIYMAYLIMTGGVGNDSGLIWFQILPLLTFSMNKLSLGIFMSVVYIAIGLFATTFTQLLIITHNYSQHVIYGFYGTFIFILMSSFIREFSLVYSKMKESDCKKDLKRLSQKDELTNTYNRRSVNEKLEELFNNKNSFALVFLDIDNFKFINDSYGHECGDIVIKKVAKIFENKLRSGDCLSRWGGEEFLIILPDTSIKSACDVSERARKILQETPVFHNDVRINITASFGAEHSDNAENKDEIILKADNKLYEAKNNGKNRVIC